MPSLILPTPFRFPDLVREVAEADSMYDGRDGHYISVGLSALRAIEEALSDAPAPPQRILDLPCGHGRVTRVLRARFPEAALTVCDIDRSGVDFVASRFGARGVYSAEDFRALDLGELYDFIWVGSLLTHLPEHQTRRFLDCMARHMAPRSTLVVSSHGERVEARLRSWNYGLAPEAVSGLLEDHARTGYGYRDYPGGQESYGISLISREWLASTLSEGPLRLHRYSEAAWDDHQDVLVLRLREGGRGSSARRFLAGIVPRRERPVPAPRHDATEAALRHGQVVYWGKKLRPGQGGQEVRQAVLKAVRAASVRLAGGKYNAGAPTARTDGRGMGHEQMTDTREAASVESFDEAWYLASYPDVQEAVARGDFPSGRAHYLGYGRREGRLPSGATAPKGADARGAEDAAAAGFDEAWYLAEYPDVAESVRRGDLRSGLEHFLACGRDEGRFPSSS